MRSGYELISRAFRRLGFLYIPSYEVLEGLVVLKLNFQVLFFFLKKLLLGYMLDSNQVHHFSELVCNHVSTKAESC
jgi:hypothetical protein